MATTGFTVHPETWRAPRPDDLRFQAAEQTKSLSALLGSHDEPIHDTEDLPLRFLPIGHAPFLQQPFAFTVPASLLDHLITFEQELLHVTSIDQQLIQATRQQLRLWADKELTYTLHTHTPKILNQLTPSCGYTPSLTGEPILNAQMAAHLFGDQLPLRPSNLTRVLQTLSPFSSVTARSLFSPHRSAAADTDFFCLPSHLHNAQNHWHQHVYHEASIFSHLLHEVAPPKDGSIQLPIEEEQKLQTIIRSLHELRTTQARIHLSLVENTSPVGHWVLFDDAILGIPSGIRQLQANLKHLQKECQDLTLLLPSFPFTSVFFSQIDTALLRDLTYALQTQGDRAAEDVLSDGHVSAKQWYKQAHAFSRKKSLLSPNY